MTSIGTVYIANLLGLSAFAEPGNNISIEGQWLSIISECTALSYILIFASAVIAYPATSRKKLFGLLICLPVILLLNLLRIVFIGWLGGHYPAYFTLFHDYLWEGGFLLAVMLIWMIWVNSFTATAEAQRRGEMTSLALRERPALRAGHSFDKLRTNGWVEGLRKNGIEGVGVRVPLVLISSFMIAYMLSGQYMKLLAHASNYLFHVLAVGGGAINSDGKVLSLISGKTLYELSMGIYYFLPFIILTILFSRGSAFRNLLTGIPVLFLIHLAAAVAAFIALLNASGDGTLMVISTIETMSPVIVWFLQRRLNGSK